MHTHRGDPQIAQLNASPHIKEKTRLIVCDALLGIHSGGPGGSPQWAEKRLIVSTDPVAADHQGMMLIEQKRKDLRLSSIHRKARHIRTAAEMGLGTDNPEKMVVRTLEMG